MTNNDTLQLIEMSTVTNSDGNMLHTTRIMMEMTEN